MNAFPGLVAVALVAACTTGGGDSRREMASAAATPLRDVGLVRPEIPLLLRDLSYPYSVTGLDAGCAAIIAEIDQLDTALGPESFQPGPSRNIWDRSGDFARQQATDAVQSTVEDLIPFRSWVRRLSGASAAEREALRAYANGQQRRTFLRGLGAPMGCPDILPPPALASDHAGDNPQR
jgi:hypothetical protein